MAALVAQRSLKKLPHVKQRCRIDISDNRLEPTVTFLPPEKGNVENALFNKFGSATFMFASIYADDKADLESLFENGIKYRTEVFHFLCGERIKSRQIGDDASLAHSKNVFKATFCSKDPHAIRAWIGTFDSQPAMKINERIRLGFSLTTAALSIRFKNVLIMDDLKSSSNNVMTDGCGFIGINLMMKLSAELGLSVRSVSMLPSAVQMRLFGWFGPAKGVLLLVNDPSICPSDCIVLRRSMIKGGKPARFDVSDNEDLYDKCFHKGSDIQKLAVELERQWLDLELVRQGFALEAEGQGLPVAAEEKGLEGPLVTWTAPLGINDVFPSCQLWQNTRLSRQVLIILVDRCHLHGGIQEFILQLATDESNRIIGVGDDDYESALKLCQSFLQRYEKGLEEDEEEDEDEDEEEEDDEEEDEQIPTTSPRKTVSGSSRRRYMKTTYFGYVENAREVYALLTSGFRPSKQPYLAKKVYELRNYRLEKLQAKSRFPIPDTEYFVGVPDPYGLLEEGEVLVHVNDGITPGGTIRSGSVLVTRCPCYLPTDIQKLTAVSSDHPLWKKTSGRGGIIYFSVKGDQSAAALMSGGDFDGDRYLVIFHEFIVSRFDPWTIASEPSPAVTSPRATTTTTSSSSSTTISTFFSSSSTTTPRAIVTPPPAVISPLAIKSPLATMSSLAVTPLRIGPFSSPSQHIETPSTTTPSTTRTTYDAPSTTRKADDAPASTTRKAYDPLGWEILQGLYESSKHSDPGKFANSLLLYQDSKEHGPTAADTREIAILAAAALDAPKASDPSTVVHFDNKKHRFDKQMPLPYYLRPWQKDRSIISDGEKRLQRGKSIWLADLHETIETIRLGVKKAYDTARRSEIELDKAFQLDATDNFNHPHHKFYAKMLNDWAHHNDVYKEEIQSFAKNNRIASSASLECQLEHQRKKQDIFDKYHILFNHSVGQLWVEQEASDSKRLTLLKESLEVSGWDIHAIGQQFPVDKERLIDSWRRCQRSIASILYTVTYTNATKQRPFNDEGLSMCWEIATPYLCEKKRNSMK